MSSVSFLALEPKVPVMITLLRFFVQFSLNFLSDSKLLSYFVNELVVQVHIRFLLAMVF